MTDKEIIDAAKAYEKSTVFGDIVLKAKGVNSSSGIGFLEGAVWMKQQMIDKACEWLKENIWKRLYVCNGEAGFPTAEFLKDFRKAMKQ